MAQSWQNFEMVVNKGDEGTYDVTSVYGPTIIKDGSTYKMWYSGRAASDYRVIYCTSSDGLTWTGHTIIRVFFYFNSLTIPFLS